MTRHDVPVEYFNGMNEPGATPWKIRPQVLDLVKACIDKGVNRQDGKVRVLDLGSGYGKNAVGLANGRVPGGEQVYDSSNVTVDAVDFSEVAIGRLEDKIRGDSIANLTATNADVRDLDYAAGSYDVVLMYGILEYLSPEEATDLVQKAQEWTAENGINLIVTLGEHDIVTLGEHDYDPKSPHEVPKSREFIPEQYEQGWSMGHHVDEFAKDRHVLTHGEEPEDHIDHYMRYLWFKTDQPQEEQVLLRLK